MCISMSLLLYSVLVLVEAVKCLCNILLNNQHLVSTLDHLGCLNAVTQRLSLCHVHKLPHQLVQFDLRFLFLITACGTSERYYIAKFVSCVHNIAFILITTSVNVQWLGNMVATYQALTDIGGKEPGIH